MNHSLRATGICTPHGINWRAMQPRPVARRSLQSVNLFRHTLSGGSKVGEPTMPPSVEGGSWVPSGVFRLRPQLFQSLATALPRAEFLPGQRLRDEPPFPAFHATSRAVHLRGVLLLVLPETLLRAECRTPHSFHSVTAGRDFLVADVAAAGGRFRRLVRLVVLRAALFRAEMPFHAREMPSPRVCQAFARSSSPLGLIIALQYRATSSVIAT